MKENVFKISSLFLISISMLLSLIAFNKITATDQRINRMNYEYQLVVEDNIVKIFDGNRYVGKALLQGELNELIISDNQ